jgi:oligopeptide transport system ATP-binding protein
VAIVGESGSGKSVFTKTFAGMLDANGFIDNGSIIFNDEALSDTRVPNDAKGKSLVASITAKLNKASKLELGSDIWNQMEQLKKEKTDRESLSAEETEKLTKKISDLQFQRTELFNQRQTVDRKNEKARYKELGEEIKAMDAQIKALRAEEKKTVADHKTAVRNDADYNTQFASKLRAFKASNPTNLKYVRDYIVANQRYLQSKMQRYVIDHIDEFEL